MSGSRAVLAIRHCDNSPGSFEISLGGMVDQIFHEVPDFKLARGIAAAAWKSQKTVLAGELSAQTATTSTASLWRNQFVRSSVFVCSKLLRVRLIH